MHVIIKIQTLLFSDSLEEIIEIIKNQKNTIHIFSETDYPLIIENNNIVGVFQKNLSNNKIEVSVGKKNHFTIHII